MLMLQAKAAIALTESAKHVFATMMSTEVTVGKPERVESRDASHDISAVIGLNGAVEGAVTIGMSFTTANAVAQAILSLEEQLSRDDLVDAIGELCNMITGNAKARLGTDGISITVPSVIIGAQHVVAIERDTPLIEMPCTSDLGAFSIRLALRPASVAALAS